MQKKCRLNEGLVRRVILGKSRYCFKSGIISAFLKISRTFFIAVRKGAPQYLQNVRSKIHDTFTSNMNYNRNGNI